MKTKYTNLAILTFFSSVVTTENLLCICRAFYLLPLLFLFCRSCFLTSQLLSFSVSSLVCLSFCGTTKKPRSLEPGGGWDLSFIHPCTHYKFVVFLTATAEMWFCFFSVASFWIWSVELWVLVFFSFPVRFFGLHLQQIRANQGNVDTSTRSCRCLDAAALIRSWGTWRRRRRRSKRRGQTDRDREEEDRQR